MAKEAIILPEASQDITEAYWWYEEQSLGLGSEFVRSVEAILASIQRYPAMYPEVFRQYRRALLRKFPYFLFYEAGR